jgi:hypothetical protein
MLANEMKYNFLLWYDKLFGMAAPAYDDRQVSAILTKAQLRVFKRYYMPNRNRFGEGFESTQKRRTDLEQFIRNANPALSANQIGVHPNGKFYDMPADFLYPVQESLITNLSTPDEITVIPVRHDEYNANIKNVYKRPYKNLAWRMDYSRADHGEDGGDAMTGRTAKRTEIITDAASSILSYRVRYLINPPAIVCDEITPASQRHCILDETLHDEIVDEAVKIAKAATAPEEYQIADKEQKENES